MLLKVYQLKVKKYQLEFLKVKTLSKILVFLCFMLIMADAAYAGFFGMTSKKQELENKEPGTQQESAMADEIPIIDKLDKHLSKRQEEAHRLIAEGRELIKQGKKRNNQDLIIKGQIKKEIGEKQLQILKEQTGSKKKEDENDHW